MKIVLSQLLRLMPNNVKNKLNYIREYNRLKRSKIIRTQKKITKQEIYCPLDSFNLNCDIFLHSSLRNFGYTIEGGKEMVAKAIIDHLDLKKHTLIASALPFRTSMKEYLDKTQLVDMRTAPIEMGAVNNAIWKMPGCLRSLHPTHSVVAIGARSLEYTISHHIDKTPFTTNSPYYKHMEYNGKILLFGVGLDHLTFPHIIEDLLGGYFPVNVYFNQMYSLKVIGLDGKENLVTTRCHNNRISAKRKCEFIRESLIENKAIQTSYLGLSEISLLDPKKYLVTYLNLLLKGKSLYGAVKINSKTEDYIIATINKIV